MKVQCLLFATNRSQTTHLPNVQGNAGQYNRTCLKQYCWDRGIGIELERLLN